MLFSTVLVALTFEITAEDCQNTILTLTYNCMSSNEILWSVELCNL